MQNAIQELIARLKELGSRHNRDCWLVPFNGRDADLEAEGCSGIAAVEEHGGVLRVTVGFHKTLIPVSPESVDNMPDDDAEEWAEECFGVVCGSSLHGEWTGEEWVMAERDSFDFPWAVNTDGVIHPVETAELLYQFAIDFVEDHYEPELKLLDEMISDIYQRAIDKYGE